MVVIRANGNFIVVANQCNVCKLWIGFHFGDHLLLPSPIENLCGKVDGVDGVDGSLINI